MYNRLMSQVHSVLQAKFATILLIIPFLVDFSVHDYVLVPFLKR